MMTEKIQMMQSLDPDMFQLIVMPTEQCNFRCTYCYEDFSVGRMQPETVASLKEFMARRINGLHALNIEWFGGEPLAARDIVLDLSEYAYRLCQENNVLLTGAATTNGYLLTKDLAENLARFDFVSYQITLDGDQEQHNRTRVLASGAPTFARIWDNLIALRESTIPVRVMLRLHLTPENYESMRRLVLRLREELLVDSRFSINIQQIENLGGPNASAIRTITKAQAEQRTHELLALAYPDAIASPEERKKSASDLLCEQA